MTKQEESILRFLLSFKKTLCFTDIFYSFNSHPIFSFVIFSVSSQWSNDNSFHLFLVVCSLSLLSVCVNFCFGIFSFYGHFGEMTLISIAFHFFFTSKYQIKTSKLVRNKHFNRIDTLKWISSFVWSTFDGSVETNKNIGQWKFAWVMTVSSCE